MATDKATFGSASEIRVTVKPGHLPAEAEAVLDAELDRLGRTTPSDAELRRAEAQPRGPPLPGCSSGSTETAAAPTSSTRC